MTVNKKIKIIDTGTDFFRCINGKIKVFNRRQRDKSETTTMLGATTSYAYIDDTNFIAENTTNIVEQLSEQSKTCEKPKRNIPKFLKDKKQWWIK